MYSYVSKSLAAVKIFDKFSEQQRKKTQYLFEITSCPWKKDHGGCGV